MNDLPKRLRIKASMIALGERVAWGSDTALMEEAADVIEALSASVENHQLHMLGMARDRDQLRTLLSEQPQASAAQSAHHNLLGELYQVLGALDAPDNVLDNVSAAIHDEPLPHATLLPFVVSAQSAPAGEREAFEAWYRQSWGYSENAKFAQDERGQYTSAHIHESWVVWQAGAAWQRTQAAGVPEGERLADLLESVWMGDDEAKPHGIGATYWNNAVIACKVAIRDALAAAPAQPAAQDQGEVQRLREALSRACDVLKIMRKHEDQPNGYKYPVSLWFPAIDTLLAASTGQEV